jgi:diguanylate cyclase (GGDEF)-like protein
MLDQETKSKQNIRMRRFLMAFLTYVTCGALGFFCAWLGYLPKWTPFWWSIVFTGVNGIFYFALRSGWNLRLDDPSMTEPQIIVSMAAAIAYISQADEARGAFLMFLVIPLLFGVFILNFRQMARLGIVGIVGYVGVIGVIWFYQPERIKFSLEALYLISLVCVMVFVCLMCGYISTMRSKLASAVLQIGELARRDSLTGLFNRRDFMERLELEIARFDRKISSGVALCMIDVDRFKAINDMYGHPIGDQVLIAVGKCLSESIRTMDYVARYGGEEFVVLMNAESIDLAHSICERVRHEVSQLQIDGIPDLSIKVSVGIACLATGESSTTLIERADKALYAAKANGRNCIFVAPDISASEYRRFAPVMAEAK